MTPLLEIVPFARTLGITFTSATAESAVAHLPDAGPLHNHVGGPHAGVMFSLGETASGAIVLAAFGTHLHLATPLAVRASINYVKLAMGTVTASARLARPAAEVVGELESGGRPEFDVHIVISDPDGVTTGEMTVTWTLRPNR
jgi:acyl-coenzyme A thioesterase PaaI-like protein